MIQGWALELNATASDSWDHRTHSSFIRTGWDPQAFNLLPERTLRYQYPDGRSCYRTMMSNVIHAEPSICYKHVQITYKTSGETRQQHE